MQVLGVASKEDIKVIKAEDETRRGARLREQVLTAAKAARVPLPFAPSSASFWAWCEGWIVSALSVHAIVGGDRLNWPAGRGHRLRR